MDVSKENLARADQIHKVHLVYSICNRNNGSLGGGGYGSSIGGELSKPSMQKTVDVMVKYQELNEKSVVIDLGSGRGMPDFHFAQCGVALSVGIEIESPRYLLSVANLHKVLMEANKNKLDIGTNCYFVHADIEQITSLYGVTHCYSFCKGMQEKTYRSIADVFNRSGVKYYACFQNEDKMKFYGFKVRKLYEMDHNMSGYNESHKKTVKMSGSGQQHTVYFYIRSEEATITVEEAVDPLLRSAFEFTKLDLETKHAQVEEKMFSLLQVPRGNQHDHSLIAYRTVIGEILRSRADCGTHKELEAKHSIRDSRYGTITESGVEVR